MAKKKEERKKISCPACRGFSPSQFRKASVLAAGHKLGGDQRGGEDLKRGLCGRGRKGNKVPSALPNSPSPKQGERL